MDKFRPSAVIMQCGGDSLSGDRLGCFNLSIKGVLNIKIFFLLSVSFKDMENA